MACAVRRTVSWHLPGAVPPSPLSSACHSQAWLVTRPSGAWGLDVSAHVRKRATSALGPPTDWPKHSASCPSAGGCFSHTLLHPLSQGSDFCRHLKAPRPLLLLLSLVFIPVHVSPFLVPVFWRVPNISPYIHKRVLFLTF